MPAEYMVVSTMNIMNSILRVEILFMAVLLVVMALAITSIVKVHRSNKLVKMQQKNNQEQQRLRQVAEDALNAAEALKRVADSSPRDYDLVLMASIREPYSYRVVQTLMGG